MVNFVSDLRYMCGFVRDFVEIFLHICACVYIDVYICESLLTLTEPHTSLVFLFAQFYLVFVKF